jgi:type IV secretory pathway VirJ component
MKKYILLLLIPIFIITGAGLFIISSKFKNKNKIAEIDKEFKRDKAFIHDDLDDLPLLLFENKDSKKDYFVILLSGDGGRKGFINVVAKTISEKGVSVVGLNLLPFLI